jgi:hypothetical protein
MPKHVLPLLSCLALLLSAGPASAQQERRTGLVMAAPAQVGFFWTLTDRVAVRPDLSWVWSTSTLDAPSIIDGFDYSSSATTSRVSFGVSLLFYLGGDQVRTYVAPRYAVSRTSASLETDVGLPEIPGLFLPDRQDSQLAHSGGCSFGVSHLLHERLGLFGEAGFEVTGASGPALSGVRARGHSVGTSGRLGIVWMF